MSDRHGIMTDMTADTHTTETAEIVKTCEIFNRRPGGYTSPSRRHLLAAETDDDRILGDDWVIRGVVHRADATGQDLTLRDEIVASGFLSAAEAAAWAAEHGWQEFDVDELDEAACVLEMLAEDPGAATATLARYIRGECTREFRSGVESARLPWCEETLNGVAEQLGHSATPGPMLAALDDEELIEVKDILSFHAPEKQARSLT